jgi:hypothetical protein
MDDFALFSYLTALSKSFGAGTLSLTFAALTVSA